VHALQPAILSQASPRVAVIGAGPAGFYAAEYLLRQHPTLEVDLFDRLPTPFGLVRTGVAPDHQKIKSVTRVFERVADDPRFRFFGNVCFGVHMTLDDLKTHYHQVLFTTGAQTDRALGIPGEDLPGSHSATEFVAWYNGHPDYTDRHFNLDCERVVVVGIGNVAVDVARILCRTPRELEQTDIADYALEALRKSSVREVIMLGRRGPAQAAFTHPEVKELGAMEDADLVIREDEARLDPLSEKAIEESADRQVQKVVSLLQEAAARPPAGKSRRIVVRFLVSPVELLPSPGGEVGAVRIVRNRLVEKRGRLAAEPTDSFEEISAGLVLRSVGYRGEPIKDLPFHEQWAIVPNTLGRVTGPDDAAIPGLYVAGWIKRGPSGIIGTNKPDAQETGAAMLEDLAAGRTWTPTAPDRSAIERLITGRQPCVFTFDDWKRLDAHEAACGKQVGRPRVKLTTLEEMIEAVRQGSGIETVAGPEAES
jgi:ferredoxin/flavodoxin---NADP+ reductase